DQCTRNRGHYGARRPRAHRWGWLRIHEPSGACLERKNGGVWGWPKLRAQRLRSCSDLSTYDESFPALSCNWASLGCLTLVGTEGRRVPSPGAEVRRERRYTCRDWHCQGKYETWRRWPPPAVYSEL